MLNLLRAEWTKLRSTSSFWWNSGLILAFSAIFGALMGYGARMAGKPFGPLTIAASVVMIDMIIVIVQSAMTVTTEYRFGIPATNFRIAPKRWQVAVAKLLLGAALAALVTALGLVVAFVCYDLAAPVASNWVSTSAAHRALWAMPLGMALVTLFTQGVGWLARNTAGTIVIMIVMMLLVETLAALIPRIGPDVVKYLPFGNLLSFMNNQEGSWSIGVSLLVFTVWAVAAWVAGVVALEARDA